MEQLFVKLNKNQARSFNAYALLEDVDRQGVFIAQQAYEQATGDVADDDELYFLATWPDTEMYQQVPAFEEQSFEVEDGVLIPRSWDQEIPKLLMGFQDDDDLPAIGLGKAA